MAKRTAADMMVDNTPPLPAKVKPEQALHLAEALAKGEPDRLNIMRTVFKDKVREVI